MSQEKLKKISLLKKVKESFHLFDNSSEESIYIDLANGEKTVKDLVRKIEPKNEIIESNEDETLTQKFIRKARGIAKGVTVGGISNTLIKYGKCCNPIPGDNIVGYVTQGRGVTIHRASCNNYPVSDSNRLITVSRFDKRKNHEKVIMAIRNLKELYPNIIYVCLGYGDEENNLKNLVNELNLNNNVIFLKNIDDGLKNALVCKSNIFVMPSIIHNKSVEGFGIAYIEAAQYGIPSIGGKDGGASDAIVHDKTGLICDGNNLEDIYCSIDKMLKNHKYKEYGKSAKEFSKNFHWEKIIKNYQKIL